MKPPRTDNPLGTSIVKGPQGPSSPVLERKHMEDSAREAPAVVIGMGLKYKDLADEIATLRHRIELLEEEMEAVTKIAAEASRRLDANDDWAKRIEEAGRPAT